VNASSTFPGIPFPEYPDVMYNVPPAMTGAMLTIEPPCALIPFTVWKS
jgi:hypothetical protein